MGRGPRGVPSVPAEESVELVADIRDVDAPRTVVSSEGLSTAGTKTVARVVADLGADRVHVVTVERSLDRLLPSAWQERVKSSNETQELRGVPRRRPVRRPGRRPGQVRVVVGGPQPGALPRPLAGRPRGRPRPRGGGRRGEPARDLGRLRAPPGPVGGDAGPPAATQQLDDVGAGEFLPTPQRGLRRARLARPPASTTAPGRDRERPARVAAEPLRRQDPTRVGRPPASYRGS